MKKEINWKKIFLLSFLPASIYFFIGLQISPTSQTSNLWENKMLLYMTLIIFVVIFFALLFNEKRKTWTEKTKKMWKMFVWSIPALYLIYMLATTTFPSFTNTPLYSIILIIVSIMVLYLVEKEIFENQDIEEDFNKIKNNISMEKGNNEQTLKATKNNEPLYEIYQKNKIKKEDKEGKKNDRLKILGKNFGRVERALIVIGYFFIFMLNPFVIVVYLPDYIHIPGLGTWILFILILLASIILIRMENKTSIVGYIIIFIVSIKITIDSSSIYNIFFITSLLSGYNIYKLISSRPYNKLEKKEESI